MGYYNDLLLTVADKLSLSDDEFELAMNDSTIYNWFAKTAEDFTQSPHGWEACDACANFKRLLKTKTGVRTLTKNRTYYRADSVRKENAGSNEFAPIGKFCPKVDETEITALEADVSFYGEPIGEWYCQVAYGSTVGMYYSAVEALQAGHEKMIHDGWTQDREKAIAEAIKLATERGSKSQETR